MKNTWMTKQRLDRMRKDQDDLRAICQTAIAELYKRKDWRKVFKTIFRSASRKYYLSAFREPYIQREHVVFFVKRSAMTGSLAKTIPVGALESSKSLNDWADKQIADAQSREDMGLIARYCAAKKLVSSAENKSSRLHKLLAVLEGDE